MFDFFRKERDYIFISRFEKTSNDWKLKSSTIFKSKKDTKSFTIIIDGKKINIKCAVSGKDIVITTLHNGLDITVKEENIATLLATKPHDSIAYHAINNLCKSHATSSASSLFISGCAVNNFEEGKVYPGYKLKLKLLSRVPFANPHVSGLEREYFLVGSVSDSDCDEIEYLGQTLGKVDGKISQNIKPLWKAKAEAAKVTELAPISQQEPGTVN